MILSQYEQFEYVCLSQRIRLHPQIVAAVANGATTKVACYAPEAASIAIAEAGYLLRKQPGERLVNATIDLPGDLAADVAIDSLVRILNSSSDPILPQVGAAHFICDGVQAVDTCERAEIRFIDTFDALEYMDSPADVHTGIGFQVVSDGTQPLLLRKSIGEPSAISLQEIYINGIPYPPGSLMRVDLQQDITTNAEGHETPGSPHVPFDEISTIAAEEVNKIAFQRLSAFALPPGGRGAFDVFARQSSHRTARLAESYTMPQLQEKLGEMALNTP